MSGGRVDDDVCAETATGKELIEFGFKGSF